MSTHNKTSYDVIVIGSGPAGQKAAIQAAKSGRSVAMIEQERRVGGACVHRGTIPSKTLRETALQIVSLRRGAAAVAVKMDSSVEVATLMNRLDEVIESHSSIMKGDLDHNNIDFITGRASFTGSHAIDVNRVRGPALQISAKTIIVATGSHPRKPPNVPIDHEHILDSDSILSMLYLPTSMTVLGAGVIASEYASIFSALGVKVTMIDKGLRPVAFMDPELSELFRAEFEDSDSRYLPNSDIKSVEWDGLSSVVTTLGSGEEIRSDKLLCALGRLANVQDLKLDNANIEMTPRGHIKVDENCETNIPGVYGVGDVIGPPALASVSMEQGRRAMRHALGLPKATSAEHIPVGIYTIPEMSSVGITEAQAIERHGGCTVGRAKFSEVARGQISNDRGGVLILVGDAQGERLLGAHIVGGGSCELIHIAQVALISEWSIQSFVDNIFNFPTLAEAYRIAALNLLNKHRSVVESHDDAHTMGVLQATG